jgi:hypothetical protein
MSSSRAKTASRRKYRHRARPAASEDDMRRQIAVSILAAALWLFGLTEAGAAITSVTVVPSPAVVRTPVTIFVAGVGTACLVVMNFGDGTTRTFTSNLPFTQKHSYTKTGTFTVTAFSANCGGGVVATLLTVNTQTTGPFALQRLELRFANGRGEITVPRDTRKLKAFADIVYVGSGILTAAWEVDGRTLAIIHETLTFGARKVIESPDAPEFPTFEPGLHRVTLRIISPTTDFIVPTINYYVEARSGAAPLELISPADNATLPESPVAFRWKPLAGVASYQVEIYEDGKKEPLFKALTRDSSYTLPEINEKIFTVGRRYSWQVRGLDQNGKEIAASEVRRFDWQPEPGAGTFLSRQALAGLRPAGQSVLDPMIAELESRHGLRRLDVYELRSIDTTLVLFEIVRPQTVASVVAALAADPRVLFVEPNLLSQASAKRNDPLAGLQTGPPLIGVPQVFHRFSGNGVRVAIIDTGVESAHPDLAGRIAERANFADGDGGMDVHGTVIAGIIGAAADNGVGIYGIAPRAELLAIRACWPKVAGQAEAVCTAHALAKGLDFAILKAAKVINLSIGGPKDVLIPKLVDRAAALGIIVVAAVGNRGPKGEPVYPAALANVIAVTAIDGKGALYPYASHGDYIDVAAPGVNILSTTAGGIYASFSGASVAAAHVSGAAALLLEAKPDLDPRALQSLLESTAQDLGAKGKDPQFGSGRIDVCRALEKITGEKFGCP